MWLLYHFIKCRYDYSCILIKLYKSSYVTWTYTFIAIEQAIHILFLTWTNIIATNIILGPSTFAILLEGVGTVLFEGPQMWQYISKCWYNNNEEKKSSNKNLHCWSVKINDALTLIWIQNFCLLNEMSFTLTIDHRWIAMPLLELHCRPFIVVHARNFKPLYCVCTRNTLQHSDTWYNCMPYYDPSTSHYHDSYAKVAPLCIRSCRQSTTMRHYTAWTRYGIKYSRLAY